jgi:hypothetical protein
VYEDRKKILSVFEHVSVFRTGTLNNIFLYTYKDSLKNEYVFERRHERMFFFRDSLKFSPDVVLNTDKDKYSNGSLYGLELIDKLQDLKIYMKSGYIVLYVSDLNRVTNKEWGNYVKSMKKLDANWYYSMTDK